MISSDRQQIVFAIDNQQICLHLIGGARASHFGWRAFFSIVVKYGTTGKDLIYLSISCAAVAYNPKILRQA